MMSTPAPISVESVRENRAMPTFMTTAPIPTGAFSRILSQTRWPCVVFLARSRP